MLLTFLGVLVVGSLGFVPKRKELRRNLFVNSQTLSPFSFLAEFIQTFLVGISAGLGAFGIANVTIPDFVPPEYKVQIAVATWLAGIVGFA